MQKSLFSLEKTSPAGYEKLKWAAFRRSSWGKLYSVIPWQELVALLPPLPNRGPTSRFDNQGMLAVMFLKHHTGLSDEKLLESINHNPSQQFFCGIKLGRDELIKNTGLISRIRGYLAHHLDFDKFQEVLVKHWKDDLAHQGFLKMDATCVESYIRYPTDVKLLWESCQWIYSHIFKFRKQSGIRLGKAKERYDEQAKKQLGYARLQRKGYKRSRRRIRALLHLLSKGGWMLIDLLSESAIQAELNADFYRQLGVIFEVLDQQRFLFDHPGQKVKERIVSLPKPYLQPIKRGKEKKPTEFGAKVHVLQVDGLCIIEHFSWNAFHEGNRLEKSVELHQKLFGKTTQLSADRIYATNSKRKYCATKDIQTSFIGKGRKPKKSIQKLKAALNKDRATRLEGSFGNQKNHYLLDKVKAQNEHTEKAWCYFGMMTANAVWIYKKRERPKKKKRLHIKPELPELLFAA